MRACGNSGGNHLFGFLSLFSSLLHQSLAPNAHEISLLPPNYEMREKSAVDIIAGWKSLGATSSAVCTYEADALAINTLHSPGLFFHLFSFSQENISRDTFAGVRL